MRNALAYYQSAEAGSLLAHMVMERPEVLGFFESPYLNAHWAPGDRLSRFRDHVQVAESIRQLSFRTDQRIELLSLDEVSEGLKVVIDKPLWFHREGVATINLFENDARLVSLSFSIEQFGRSYIAIVGGLQGQNAADALDRYRALTKSSFGMRPRDLLFEIFRMMCAQIAVVEIYAIKDAARHHRNSFFKREKLNDSSLNYDEVWIDRGGLSGDGDFFRIPLQRQIRDENDIPARKRTQYRRRYEFLDRLEREVAMGWSTAKPVQRLEAD